LLENELDLTVVEGARADVGGEGVGERSFREAVEDGEDGFREKADRDGGVEGVRGELVLVHMLRAAERFSNCDEEVISREIRRGERLEHNAAVAAHP
jgi:hypothetical protein